MAWRPVEDVIADFHGAHHLAGPGRLDVNLMIVQRPARQRGNQLAAHNAGGELLGGLPSVPIELALRRTVGQKGELAGLADHAADRVRVTAAAHALQDHFGNRLLTVLAFAAGLIIEGLSHAGDFGLLGPNLMAMRCKRRKKQDDAALCHTRTVASRVPPAASGKRMSKPALTAAFLAL